MAPTGTSVPHPKRLRAWLVNDLRLLAKVQIRRGWLECGAQLKCVANRDDIGVSEFGIWKRCSYLLIGLVVDHQMYISDVALRSLLCANRKG